MSFAKKLSWTMLVVLVCPAARAVAAAEEPNAGAVEVFRTHDGSGGDTKSGKGGGAIAGAIVEEGKGAAFRGGETAGAGEAKEGRTIGKARITTGEEPVKDGEYRGAAEGRSSGNAGEKSGIPSGSAVVVQSGSAKGGE